MSKEIAAKQFPALYVHGYRDPFIQKPIQEEYSAKIGISQDHFDVYNENTQLVKKGL